MGIEGGTEEVTIFSFSGLRDAEIGLRMNVQSEKGDFSVSINGKRLPSYNLIQYQTLLSKE